jgi:glycosyltransferase involved in cell wall biosynthesis
VTWRDVPPILVAWIAGASPRRHSPFVANPLRILAVAPYPPRVAATHGGAKALGEFLLQSAERHRVGLVYLRHSGEPDIDEALRARLELVESVARPVEPHGAAHLRRVFARRLRLLAGTPLAVTELASNEFEDVVQRAARTWQPDLIRLEPSVAASFVRDARVPTVLVDQDPLLTTASDVRGFGRRAEAALNRRAARRFDRRARARADAVVVFTERDRRAVTASGGARRLVQIPIAIEPLPALDPAGTSDGSLLFVGNLNHPANRQAVRHAAEEIFPQVRRARADARLTVVGQLPAGGGFRIEDPGVELTGLVDDVVPYLDEAAVFVAPLRTGGGMRVKVLEALSAGKAVVAYREALDGLAVEHEGHVLVAANPQDFAALVLRLLADRNERAELGRAARDWALANVSWDAVLDAYDELYDKLLAGSPQSDHGGVAN